VLRIAFQFEPSIIEKKQVTPTSKDCSYNQKNTKSGSIPYTLSILFVMQINPTCSETARLQQYITPTKSTTSTSMSMVNLLHMFTANKTFKFLTYNFFYNINIILFTYFCLESSTEFLPHINLSSNKSFVQTLSF